MQLASTSTPRSAANSATCSYDSGYRRYQRMHKMITSPGCCRPLNGLLGVIGMDFYPTSLSTRKFATESFALLAVSVDFPKSDYESAALTAELRALNHFECFTCA